MAHEYLGPSGSSFASSGEAAARIVMSQYPALRELGSASSGMPMRAVDGARRPGVAAALDEPGHGSFARSSSLRSAQVGAAPVDSSLVDGSAGLPLEEPDNHVAQPLGSAFYRGSLAESDMEVVGEVILADGRRALHLQNRVGGPTKSAGQGGILNPGRAHPALARRLGLDRRVPGLVKRNVPNDTAPIPTPQPHDAWMDGARVRASAKRIFDMAMLTSAPGGEFLKSDPIIPYAKTYEDTVLERNAMQIKTTSKRMSDINHYSQNVRMFPIGEAKTSLAHSVGGNLTQFQRVNSMHPQPLSREGGSDKQSDYDIAALMPDTFSRRFDSSLSSRAPSATETIRTPVAHSIQHDTPGVISIPHALSSDSSTISAQHARQMDESARSVATMQARDLLDSATTSRLPLHPDQYHPPSSTSLQARDSVLHEMTSKSSSDFDLTDKSMTSLSASLSARDPTHRADASGPLRRISSDQTSYSSGAMDARLPVHSGMTATPAARHSSEPIYVPSTSNTSRPHSDSTIISSSSVLSTPTSLSNPALSTPSLSSRILSNKESESIPARHEHHDAKTVHMIPFVRQSDLSMTWNGKKESQLSVSAPMNNGLLTSRTSDRSTVSIIDRSNPSFMGISASAAFPSAARGPFERFSVLLAQAARHNNSSVDAPAARQMPGRTSEPKFELPTPEGRISKHMATTLTESLRGELSGRDGKADRRIQNPLAQSVGVEIGRQTLFAAPARIESTRVDAAKDESALGSKLSEQRRAQTLTRVLSTGRRGMRLSAVQSIDSDSEVDA